MATYCLGPELFKRRRLFFPIIGKPDYILNFSGNNQEIHIYLVSEPNNLAIYFGLSLFIKRTKLQAADCPISNIITFGYDH
jgi:hypothetical protein